MLAHLAQAEIDSVVKGGQSVRAYVQQAILEIVDAGRKGAYELRAVVEIYEEEFILRVRRAEELHRRLRAIYRFYRT